MRVAPAVLLGVLLAGAADAQEAVWNQLEIRAELADDGRLNVTENHEIALSGDVQKLDRDIGLGVGQKFAFKGIARLDDKGVRHPLEAGDLKLADRYADYGGWMQWSLRAPDAPPFAGEVRRYVLEYEIVNALAPAWDLPNGPLVLDPFHPSFRSPLDRAREILALWRTAWPRLDRHYRVDHDVIFPNRDKAGFHLTRLDYHLEWDLAHWRLLDEKRDIGQATPDVDYRVQRTLEYLPAGRPAAVDFRSPAIRIGSIVGLPLAGLLLWLLALVARRLRRLGEPTADQAFFEANVLSEPPELAGARISGQGTTPFFESFLLRLAAERKLAIEVTEPGGDDTPAKSRLRLLVDKTALHPYEREALDALFGEGREITTDEIQSRHAGREFDPQQILEASFERARPRPVRGGKGALVFAFLLFFPGAALAFMDLLTPGREVIPYALGAGFVGGFVGILPFPLLLLALAGVAIPLVPCVPLTPAGSAGIALMLLSRYPERLRWGLSRKNATARQFVDFALAREWAAAELKKPRPALRDAWIPHLEAIGLAGALKKWKARYGGTQAAGAPDLADLDPSQLQMGPGFTGTAPAAAEPSDQDWADAFYVWKDE